MLDDLKAIHERDAQDALGVAERQWKQLGHIFELGQGERALKSCKNMVFAGMGGSALAAQLSMTWPGYDIPMEICRNYAIPQYVTHDTLFIASSYSGNTEETLSALAAAEAAGAKIAVISAGGKLAAIAADKGYALATLPGGLQPRMATLYSLKALITILEAAGIVQDALQTLEGAAQHIQDAVEQWVPVVATKNNQAKQIAQELMGKSPVIYAGPLMYPAAYKWKISCNENAKNVAWCSQYPEFNHNEFLGWTSHPVQKPYAIVELKSSFEHPRVQKRFEVSSRLLSGLRPSPIDVNIQGKTVLEQLLWAVVLGDFVSLYLALLNGLNPTPVDLIEKLKTALS